MLHPCHPILTRMRHLFPRLFVHPGTRPFDAAAGGRRWERVRLPSFPDHSRPLLYPGCAGSERLRAMRTLLHRLLGSTRTRGFDAAGGGRRWEGARTVDGLNTAILTGATTAARRAGWYARNNPWVAAA
ncbi:MAG: hypothetical protein ACK8QZ_06905, partial [Anaerolineales bacterium]